MNAHVLASPHLSTPRHRDRVRRKSSAQSNRHIDMETMRRVYHYANQPREKITQRIEELNREWDVDQRLQTQASSIGLAGIVLSLVFDRRWLLLSGLAFGTLIRHSSKGSGWTVAWMRKQGVRTRPEIEAEKYALKILRGDFDSLKGISDNTHRASEALRLSLL